MSQLEIHQFICRSDNYGVLVHDPLTDATVSIDAGDAAAIERELAAKGWRLTHILTTHHHGDHVEGNEALQAKYDCEIIGPKGEAEKIPALGRMVGGGDVFKWAEREVKVYDCPGHTKGHIAFYIPSASVLFAADTVFSLGCGRVLEGTMEQMHQSVNQFRKLPADTLLYCGHEYTENNARFALSVEPRNSALQARAAEVSKLRKEGKMTCPTTLALELETNPFLRCASPEIRRNLGLEKAGDAEVFAALRRAKDSFK